MIELGGFCELSSEESVMIDAGGKVALFLSMLGIAFSPAVACLNPAGGAGMFVSCGSVFIGNLK